MQMKLTAAKRRRCRCNVQCIWVAAPFPHGRHCMQYPLSYYPVSSVPNPKPQNQPHQLRNMQESCSSRSISRTTPIFGCIIASLNQWGASCCRCAVLCCACLLLLALHPYMTRSDFIVNAVCHCRLPSPSASLHPHSHPTPSPLPSPSPPPSPCPMSQVLCPCPSRSSSIFAMILSSSEVMSLPWLCCRAHGYPPFETPVPHPCATTAVTWVQLFF